MSCCKGEYFQNGDCQWYCCACGMVNPGLQLINAAKSNPCVPGDGPLSFNLSNSCLNCNHQRCFTLQITQFHESHSASRSRELTGQLAPSVSESDPPRAVALSKTIVQPVNDHYGNDILSAHAIDHSHPVTTCDPESLFHTPHVPSQPAVRHGAGTDADRISQPGERSQYNTRTHRNSAGSKRQHHTNGQKRLSVPSVSRRSDDSGEGVTFEAEHGTHQYRLTSLVNDCIYACPFFKRNPNDPQLKKACRSPFTLSRLREHLIGKTSRPRTGKGRSNHDIRQGPHTEFECENCLFVFETEAQLEQHEECTCTRQEVYEYPATWVGKRLAQRIKPLPRGPRSDQSLELNRKLWEEWFSELNGKEAHIPSCYFDEADLARVGAPFEVQDSRSQLDQIFASQLPNQKLEEALRFHMDSVIKMEEQFLRASIRHTARFEQAWVKLAPTFSSRRKRPRLWKGTQEVTETVEIPIIGDDSFQSYTSLSHLESDGLIQLDFAHETGHPNEFMYEQNPRIYEDTTVPQSFSPPPVLINDSTSYNQPAMFGTTPYQWTDPSNLWSPPTYPSTTDHEPLGVPNDVYLSPMEGYNLSPVHPRLSSPQLQHPAPTMLDKHSLPKEEYEKSEQDTTIHQPQASHGIFDQDNDPLDPRSIPLFAGAIPGGDIGPLLQEEFASF